MANHLNSSLSVRHVDLSGVSSGPSARLLFQDVRTRRGCYEQAKGQDILPPPPGRVRVLGWVVHLGLIPTPWGEGRGGVLVMGRHKAAPGVGK